MSNFVASSRPRYATGRPLFHLWIPEMFNFKGGIQTYSAFLLRALQILYPDAIIRTFSKNDTRSVLPPKSAIAHAETTFSVAGDWSLPLRTGIFAGQLLWAGVHQRPHLIIATHLHFAPVAYWLNQITGVPYWVIAHGVEAWALRSTRLALALRSANKILAVSDYTRNRLASELSLYPRELDLLPNTYDERQFQIRPKPVYLLERYGLDAAQPVILTVARLSADERYKGYDQVLRALPIVRQIIPNVHYIIAGKGDDRLRIENLIATLGLQDVVTLAGFVPDEELCDHYCLCNLFAMPSKGEGFGIVYLEALACGKPVLGGNQDGATDALYHGELGILVNPDNVPEIAQAVIEILQGTHPHPLIYHPEALRRAVIDRFGFDQFKQTLANYATSMMFPYTENVQ